MGLPGNRVRRIGRYGCYIGYVLKYGTSGIVD